MDKKKTGELIKDARTKKNYTQSELGGLIGVSNKAVSRWETGESFPDIGLLESLSNVLDLKIQDIVVGEIQADDETAFTEIVRMSKLQAKAKQKTILSCAVGILIVLYSCLIGYAGFGKSGMYGGHLGMIYFICLTVTLLLILFLNGSASVKEDFAKKDVVKENGKAFKYMFPASVISVIWMIFAVFSTAVLAGGGRLPSFMEASSVGPFLCYQLIVIFLFNLVFMANALYRISIGKGYAYAAVSVPVTAIYLAALYADALHRLSAAGEFYEMLCIRTTVVLAEFIIFVIAAKVFKK